MFVASVDRTATVQSCQLAPQPDASASPPNRPQLYVDKARLEESQPGGFDLLKSLVDVGDVVGASGSVKRTEKGELSVVAGSLSILTKSLLPLPDKWHGLVDVEKRYKQVCPALPGDRALLWRC